MIESSWVQKIYFPLLHITKAVNVLLGDTVIEVVVYPPDSDECCTPWLEVMKIHLSRKLLTVVFYIGSELFLIRYGSVRLYS